MSISAKFPWVAGLELVLAMAVAARHQDLVLFLIQHGATIDRYGGFGLSPLMIAVHDRPRPYRIGRASAAEWRGLNALELAAKKEFKDVVDILLGHGADPNCQSTYPRSPGRKTRSVRAYYYCSAVLSDHAIPRRILNHYDGEGRSNYSGSAVLKSRNEIGT